LEKIDKTPRRRTIYKKKNLLRHSVRGLRECGDSFLGVGVRLWRGSRRVGKGCIRVGQTGETETKRRLFRH